jgi:hypothetical protein
MASVFIYVVDRDFGFAPNPFHGYCTLATCKPRIRNPAQVGDWVIGMAGSRIGATGRCVFAMQVSGKIDFNTYWEDRRYIDKRPIRNGSSRAVVGDNIYHLDPRQNKWRQADSHHSNKDGSPNLHNLNTDTSSKFVLLSRHFYYFGRSAPEVDKVILRKLGYKNGRQHRRFTLEEASPLLDWLKRNFGGSVNLVLGDPFDFDQSHSRYDVKSNKVS